MFGLGPIKWLGGYVAGSVVAGYIAIRILEAVWLDAPRGVYAAIFHRGMDPGRDLDDDG